jgi:hypothetical protein
LDVMSHISNLSIWEVEENHKFKDSLGYIAKYQ